MNAMGGVKFFHIAVENAKDNMSLLEKVLEGFNKEVDESAEDRKGGAGDLGKILLSASDAKLNLLCHVPAEIASEIDQAEWFKTVCEACGATAVDSSEATILRAVLMADADKGVFPIKVRDDAINAGYNYLVSKMLIRPDESDDDANYAEDAGTFKTLSSSYIPCLIILGHLVSGYPLLMFVFVMSDTNRYRVVTSLARRLGIDGLYANLSCCSATLDESCQFSPTRIVEGW